VIERLKAGVELEDGPARFDEIAVISRGGSHSWFRVVIREGRNREVRRLWDSQGYLVSRLKRIRYGNIELPRLLRRGDCEPLGEDAVKQLRQASGLGPAQPVLTLSPVLHQRRANRNVTEYRPADQAPAAWSGAYHDEARELRAFDRIREEPARGRPKQRRPGKEVNGNVARPERAPGGGKRKNKRGVAPGQELPSVRTWFAGDTREGGRSGGGEKKPFGKRPGGGAGSGGFGAGRAGGSGKRPGQSAAGRPQGHGGGKRPQKQGGGRPHGGGGRGGNRSGNR
jgi:23S rRNA pseudouridine2605 synthase